MGEDSRTLWCGNLSSRCTENILYELFLQGGPLEKVYIPKDRDGTQKSFGFIIYKHSMSVPYALNLFEGTALYNRPLSLKARQLADQQASQQMPYNINPPNLNHILQLGNQMLLGNAMSNLGMNMMPMFLPLSGMMQYPSQANNVGPFVKEDRRGARNHPYNRERERDRYSERGHRNHREHRDHRSNDYYRHNNGRNYR